MRRRIGAAGIVVVIVTALSGTPFAAAQDVSGGTATVTATVAEGSRALVVEKVALALTGPRSAMTDTYDIGVTETSRNGTNTWRVQASFAAGALTGLTSGVVLANSDLSISQRNQTLGTWLLPADTTGVATGDIGAEGDFSAARDVLVVTGEDSATAYTTSVAHDATGQITLVVPGEAPSDEYTGALTFTLLNA